MSDTLVSVSLDDDRLTIKAIGETKEEAEAELAAHCEAFGAAGASVSVWQTFPHSWVAEAVKYMRAENVAVP